MKHFNTDKERKHFKDRLKLALADIEKEFDVSFEFGRIDDHGPAYDKGSNELRESVRFRVVALSQGR